MLLAHRRRIRLDRIIYSHCPEAFGRKATLLRLHRSIHPQSAGDPPSPDSGKRDAVIVDPVKHIDELISGVPQLQFTYSGFSRDYESRARMS